MSDLISRSALKEEFDIIASKSATGDWQLIPIKHIKQIIDNVQTVNIPNYGGQVVPDMLQGWRYDERSQGGWVRKEDIIHLLERWSDGYSYIEIPTDTAIKAIKEMKGDAK